MRLRRLLLAALLVGAAMPALAREWYDAYQAGLRALARGQAQEAVFLLGEAIVQHPEPGRNVRTYGTNVEPRYFPYLRLAEAYLALGSGDGARAALERSAHFGVEPAGERVLLAARTQALLARATATPVPPPPTTTSASGRSPTAVAACCLVLSAESPSSTVTCAPSSRKRRTATSAAASPRPLPDAGFTNTVMRGPTTPPCSAKQRTGVHDARGV